MPTVISPCMALCPCRRWLGGMFPMPETGRGGLLPGMLPLPRDRSWGGALVQSGEASWPLGENLVQGASWYDTVRLAMCRAGGAGTKGAPPGTPRVPVAP